jgi:hypothetical protein
MEMKKVKLVGGVRRILIFPVFALPGVYAAGADRLAGRAFPGSSLRG